VIDILASFEWAAPTETGGPGVAELLWWGVSAAAVSAASVAATVATIRLRALRHQDRGLRYAARIEMAHERGHELYRQQAAAAAAEMAGSDLPSRSVGITAATEDTLRVVRDRLPAVTADATLLLADHIPQTALDTLAGHGRSHPRPGLPALTPWAADGAPFDVDDDTDDPPQDEARVVDRDDQDPPAGGVLTATIARPRYDWAHLSGRQLPPARTHAVLPYVLHRSRWAVAILSTPRIQVQRLHSPAREMVTRLRVELVVWRSEWARVLHRAAEDQPGRHRLGVASGPRRGLR
jgi:hypothetical protein